MSEQRVAIVTGSGKQRVGSYVAKALGERGYALAIHFHRSAKEAAETVEQFTSQGVVAQAFQADLSDEQQVQDLVDGTFARFGRLDVLVHCAATWQRKRLEDLTASDVRQSLEANTLSTFLCLQKAGLAMARQSEGGAIVTLGDWAIERPYLGHAGYFASKGAIPTLTRTMAVELASRNPRVRVNCILPGPVMLPPDLSAAEREESIRGTLVRREGRPENVAQAAMHFIDNDFITGACLPVDGGRTIFAP
jgi:pteridine reductase